MGVRECVRVSGEVKVVECVNRGETWCKSGAKVVLEQSSKGIGGYDTRSEVVEN